MVIGTIRKQPFEQLDRYVDFANDLPGSNLASIVSVTAIKKSDGSDATDIVIETISPAPFIPPGTKKVQFRVKGGIDRVIYKITVKASGSGGQQLEADVWLNVKDE